MQFSGLKTICRVTNVLRSLLHDRRYSLNEPSSIPNMKTQIATLIALVTIAAMVQGATPSTTEDVVIKYIDAATAFQSLRVSFPDASAAVTAIRLDSNSLTVAAGHPKAAELKRKLAEIDVRPRQIYVQAVITEVDADGTEKVISRPSLYMLDGQSGEISVGEHGQKQLKLKITPTSVPEVARK